MPRRRGNHPRPRSTHPERFLRLLEQHTEGSIRLMLSTLDMAKLWHCDEQHVRQVVAAAKPRMASDGIEIGRPMMRSLSGSMLLPVEAFLYLDRVIGDYMLAQQIGRAVTFWQGLESAP